ncbi:ABC transporter ATP-binding protein [Chitinispirillales bacterium ANBcel5]|uniref:ABC transporter ATP-binding protein n=1 Tax=Cellulosispirillum alkaliphilum TaxID=3039283 RepID=UPI002A5721B3|nr:ABC transporter ATP-binding protein [Chitinispirillales bacterium ANBcel5]
MLCCNDLHVSFTIHKKPVHVVRGVSFNLPEKKTLGIVGESGCGKSISALSIMRLVPSPPGKIDSGSILFKGKDLVKCSEKEMRKIRGQSISMIFQDPMTSLNPVFSCGDQIKEVLQLHRSMDPLKAFFATKKILGEVGINDPIRVIKSYPHQLSGGMRQRVMIAMALACSPRILIADEPTTALDVTVQAKLLELLKSLQDTRDMSMILITHNMGIVADLAHEVIVMYAGEVLEQAQTDELFDSPMHPYTRCLLETIPTIHKKKDRLRVIPGEVPAPQDIPDGCPFHPRCPQSMEKCTIQHPEMVLLNEQHKVRCHLYE